MEYDDLSVFMNEKIDDINIFSSPYNKYEYCKEKEKIFNINNYKFLKQKRVETKVKSSKSHPWSEDEVYYYNLG
jgi:hypothetical protein